MASCRGRTTSTSTTSSPAARSIPSTRVTSRGSKQPGNTAAWSSTGSAAVIGASQRANPARVQANRDIRTFVHIRLGGAGGARTHDRRIMRSTASCTTRASCTDDTDHRTGGSHHAGTIWRAGPRTGPRPRHPCLLILLLCVTPLRAPSLRPRERARCHRANRFAVLSCLHLHMLSDLRKHHRVRFRASTLSAICPYPRAPPSPDRTDSHGHRPAQHADQHKPDSRSLEYPRSRHDSADLAQSTDPAASAATQAAFLYGIEQSGDGEHGEM